MDRLSVAEGSKYKCYFAGFSTSFCNTTLGVGVAAIAVIPKKRQDKQLVRRKVATVPTLQSVPVSIVVSCFIANLPGQL